jgi:hypothetical protein
MRAFFQIRPGLELFSVYFLSIFGIFSDLFKPVRPQRCRRPGRLVFNNTHRLLYEDLHIYKLVCMPGVLFMSVPSRVELERRTPGPRFLQGLVRHVQLRQVQHLRSTGSDGFQFTDVYHIFGIIKKCEQECSEEGQLLAEK